MDKKIAAILKKHGVHPKVVAAVKADLVVRTTGPRLSRETISRIRRLCINPKDRCLVVLSKDGKNHRIFSFQALTNLQRGVRKTNNRKAVDAVLASTSSKEAPGA